MSRPDSTTAAPGIEKVFEAPSGRLALEILEAFEPDVVFLDVRMPGMDGPPAPGSARL